MAIEAKSRAGPVMPLLSEYTQRVEANKIPAEVLDALQQLVSEYLPLSVLGAARFPLHVSDWRSPQPGQDVFLHSSLPQGWWNEYSNMAKQAFDPGVLMARSSLMGCTWTETMRMLEPIGIDRWPYEMSFKYGIRDALTCSVGRRWLVAYWSGQELSSVLTPPTRIMLFAAASFAALRLEQLIKHQPRESARLHVTPRELAVLRLVSLGKRTREIAALLGIGEETVRSHLKKAQDKTGSRTRAQTVAEAMRRCLIP